ncbi:TMV resistance protein N-like [Dorcoceras hygrometricum]|uniref:TMV resistance protein N-like n=1 Tax=Dorcoceras hygrometricum TaxID=472368 RepID=A0A2Z7D0H1_9LAMI|nr:TMV resistance protein N-like [Dorcoceras hygrometricum]
METSKVEPKQRKLAKNGGAHCIAVSLARWTISEGIAQASCENVIWNRIYEVCWKKCRRKKMNSRCLESVAQDLVSAMMTSAYLLEKATSSNDDVSIAD